MPQAVRAIILATTKVGDKSLVLHCLCNEGGRRSFIVSVGRKAGMALFLPLNIIDGEAVENRKSTLWRLHRISSAAPLESIRGNVYKNAVCLFMSEVLYRCIHDGEGDAELFDWCARSIAALDSIESGWSNFHLRWLMELSAALGFSPTKESIAPFAGERYSEICALLDADLTSFLMAPLNGTARSEIADILLRYLSSHTECSLNIRSLAVLSEVLR